MTDWPVIFIEYRPGKIYLGVAQKIPWAGKRQLRGQQANWEATAASFDMGETKLRLAEATELETCVVSVCRANSHTGQLGSPKTLTH